MILIYIISTIYALLVVKIYFAWKTIPVFNFANEQENINGKTISVIIPVRNEETDLPELLVDLDHQSLPSHLYEVIVVDDHSTDNTAKRVQEMQGQVSYKLLLVNLSTDMDFDQSYKKKAISDAIKIAKGEIIVTTDGDCRVGFDWLQTYYMHFNQRDVVMLCGPVAFHNEKSLFEHFQTIEFASLIGTGAATLQMGVPSMCNGANLAYLKKAFYEVKGFEGVEHIHSGDDEFLMHKVYKKFKGKVSFVKERNAIVRTSAKNKLMDFVEQRKRWASKWKYYQDLKVSALAIFIFLFHFSVLLAIAFSIIGWMSWIDFLLILLMKLVPEYIFLKNVLDFLGKRFFGLYFLSLGIGYSIYAVYFGLTSHKGKYTWKGRELRTLSK